MTKISEVIKYYESILPKSEFESYFGDSHASTKIDTLQLIQKAIGDVELSDDYLKAFMFGFKSFSFKTTYEEMLQKIRIIYEISKDCEMSIKDLLTLISLYHSGTYSLMSKEIAILIKSGTDLRSGLKDIIAKALIYGLEESKKLEYLKEEYREYFIEKIKQVVEEECISSDKVLEILPSKDFIDDSKVKVPGLGVTIISGEEVVLKRLKYILVEEKYKETDSDEKIFLGYSATGEIVYTSFTKGEYEKDLKIVKKILEKK